MATDKSAIPGLRLPWAGKQVHPEQVEQELTSLWHLAADNMRISQNMNVRTSILNFVICALDAASAYKASMLLRDLSSTHIARVTLLILDMRHDLPTSVSTWVTLRSFSIISDVMRHHFEQITVRLTGDAVYSSDNIVLSLLKPDLPVYLWWLNDLPQDNTIFHRLINISSRVIVDSGTFFTPEQRIRTLSSLLQEASNSALSDLNWGRVTSWRELIAQFFDVTEYRPYLVDVDAIEIEHSVLPAGKTAQNGQPVVTQNPIQALLLAAWLKTRLGWKLSSDDKNLSYSVASGNYSWHMTNRTNTISGKLIATDVDKALSGSTGSITISMRPREQAGLAPGSICLVRLMSRSEGKQATFTLNRENDDDHVLTSAELPGNTHPQRTVNIAATHKEGDLLHSELEIMGRDHLYEETLHEVFALLA